MPYGTKTLMVILQIKTVFKLALSIKYKPCQSFFKRRDFFFFFFGGGGGCWGTKKVQTSEGSASHKGHNILQEQKVPPARPSKLPGDS